MHEALRELVTFIPYDAFLWISLKNMLEFHGIFQVITSVFRTILH